MSEGGSGDSEGVAAPPVSPSIWQETRTYPADPRNYDSDKILKAGTGAKFAIVETTVYNDGAEPFAFVHKLPADARTAQRTFSGSRGMAQGDPAVVRLAADATSS
ncbi:hypothetical protein ACFXEL_06060 [Streptomyces sp. NPDC059382]|uniref:hypothetical protein n=1 Tax=Streptomyces sp. NPDC059382 TaxID=3346816 RepID=UPI0036C33C0A